MQLKPSVVQAYMHGQREKATEGRRNAQGEAGNGDVSVHLQTRADK